MNPPTPPVPQPLPLVPLLKSKVWGGRRLQTLGKALPPSENVGESWELADLATTSASGGGGDPARTVIASGPLAGRSLHEAMDQWGAGLIDEHRRTTEGDFPLLVKYLDAREHLSVQVHPSPGYAAEHPGAHLKTESWFVVAAEPGAELFIGLQPGVTRNDLARAIEGGTVPDLLQRRRAVPGECHTLPSGTVHALGAGVLVAEVQTPSDTTFRVYDWTREYGRAKRELHIEQALACASFDEPPAPVAAGGERSVVATTEFYTMEVVRAHCKGVPVGGTGPVVVMVTKTMGAAIASKTNAWPEVTLEAGRTCLIPAACAEDAVLRCGPDTEMVLARLG
ncbi:MAG: class I mannose-6-phosphate isomerase [Phycisphaerales bacterium]|nr:class I mannose-6-phosphate isomerase [Planctomycetota bacterium]MCH8509853.1 class I mannose-6-phosphate isomerase [Phycisphaerales bacterium]